MANIQHIKRFEDEGGRYVRRIRNRSKRTYAEQVHLAMLDNLHHGSPVAVERERGNRDLTFMATQAVWMRLAAIRDETGS